MSSHKMTCCRAPDHLRHAIDSYCVANNISLSDLMRALLESFVAGQLSPSGPQGFVQARELAIKMARVLIDEATRNLPETMEEAAARGLLQA